MYSVLMNNMPWVNFKSFNDIKRKMLMTPVKLVPTGLKVYFVTQRLKIRYTHSLKIASKL